MGKEVTPDAGGPSERQKGGASIVLKVNGNGSTRVLRESSAPSLTGVWETASGLGRGISTDLR